MLEVCALASGSSGNCFYVGNDNGGILVDVGISASQVVQRLQRIEKDIKNIKGIFLTHEHSDHISGAETVSKRYKIPMFINEQTLSRSYLNAEDIFIIETNKEIDFNGLKILPFLKSHDAAAPLSLSISNGSGKVSIITDIGFGCKNVIKSIAESSVLLLEFNHDLYMLKNGNYPYELKKRIAGKKGHLSNYEASLLVLEHGSSRLNHIFLSHLSLENNKPEIALKTLSSIIAERKDLSHLKTWMTYRDKPSELVRLA